MFNRKLAALALAVLGGLGITGYASYSAGPADAAPSLVAPGTVLGITYACVDQSGTQVDYYESRSPLPHPCYYSGEYGEQLPTIVLAEGASFPASIGGVAMSCSVAADGGGLELVCADST